MWISNEELTPPPESISLVDSLRVAIRHNLLLTQYVHGWLNRLRTLCQTIENPRQWWRTDQSPVHMRREWRGLVDVMGHAFKILFGTATESKSGRIRELERMLDVSPSSYGQRRRVCRHGLINCPTTYMVVSQDYWLRIPNTTKNVLCTSNVEFLEMYSLLAYVQCVRSQYQRDRPCVPM